jgi:uncharacterized protein YndB with AHSA1/START domain
MHAMTLREKITIHAAPEAVWSLVADPARAAEWNPKIVSVGRDRSGPLQMGERFRVVYRMSGRDTEAEAAVIDQQEPSLLVIQYRMFPWPADRHVE